MIRLKTYIALMMLFALHACQQLNMSDDMQQNNACFQNIVIDKDKAFNIVKIGYENIVKYEEPNECLQILEYFGLYGIEDIDLYKDYKHKNIKFNIITYEYNDAYLIESYNQCFPGKFDFNRHGRPIREMSSDILLNCKDNKISIDISSNITSDQGFSSFLPANYLYEDGASKYYQNKTEVLGFLAGIYEHDKWVMVPVCILYKSEHSTYNESKELNLDQSLKQCLFRFIYE